MLLKRNGSKRFCIALRGVNKVTKPIFWYLPLIDDVLSLLKKAFYFTSLDIKSGYWQILFDEKDLEKTAFKFLERVFSIAVVSFFALLIPLLYFRAKWQLSWKDYVILTKRILMIFDIFC